jgi:hypothetical protein
MQTTPQNNIPWAVRLSELPAELRAKKIWCVWRLVDRGGKLTKPPYQPNGQFASHSDPATWATFEDACAAADGDSTLGVGVFNDGTYSFIDFDHCIHDDEIEGWAQAALARIDSYAEISPSGTGLHAIVRGTVAEAAKINGCEIYSRNRYFTVTCNIVSGAPLAVREMPQDQLDELRQDIADDQLRPRSITQPTATAPRNSLVIERPMSQSERETKLDRALSGDYSEYGGDRSAAVHGALQLLARKHAGDEEKMREEFEASELCSSWGAKWDRLGDAEITKALERWQENGKPSWADKTLDLVGDRVEFNPWEYALKPLDSDGQKFSGWFPLGRITLVSGSSGAMKTTFMAQALKAGRDGEMFLGHEPGRLPFYFLFADRGKWDAEETFMRMGMVGQIPYSCLDGVPALQAIADVAKCGKHKIVFIDGGDLLVEDNNDGRSVAQLTGGVQRIAEHYGVGFVISTGAGKHSAKALKDGAERRTITKGSEVWGRTSGTVFSLNSEHDGTQATRRLIVQHRNAATERFLLELRNGLLVPVNEDEISEREANTAMVDWVITQDEFTRAQFCKQFRHLSGRTANRRLEGLVGTGLLKAKARGAKTVFVVQRAWTGVTQDAAVGLPA